MQKRILFLRKMKADFVFTSNYIDLLANRLILDGYNLDVYDFRKRKLMNFSSRSVKTFFPYLNCLDNTPFRLITNFIVFIYFCLRYNCKYDLVHILYVRAEFLFSYFFIKQLSNKLIISIFGNDINENYQFKKLFTKIYYKADYILTSSPGLMKIFLTRFIPKEDQSRIKPKTRVIMFPLKSIQDMKKKYYYDKIENFRNQYNLSKDDIIITCGTTGRIKYEQLDKLVDVLKKIDLSRYKNLKIIFSISYGGNKNNINVFKKNVIENLNSDKTILLTNYIPYSDMISLRLLTDIYINIRKRDQFVASMIESLFAESHLITGSWLPYEILDNKNFFYSKINNVNEIKNILPIIIDDIIKNNNIEYYESNKNKVIDLWSPEKKIEEWNDFYKGVLH